MTTSWSLNVVSLLLESSIRACVIAGGIGVILTLGRVRPGGVRHAAWAGAVGAMLLMPGLGRVLPAIDVALPRPLAALDLAPMGASVTVPPRAASVAPASGRTAAGLDGSHAVARVSSSAPARWTWSVAAVGVYLAIVAVMLLRLAVGWLTARRLARLATPIEFTGGVMAAESNLLVSPMTIGIARPRIVVPVSWRTWPEQTRAALLAHEAAHVRRLDPLVSFVARVNRCLFWFNPLAWWLERALTANAEHACDEAGVRAMGESRRYADVLLDMAASGPAPSWARPLAGRRRQQRRPSRPPDSSRILSGDTLGAVPRWRTAAIAVACTALIASVSACRQPVPEPLREYSRGSCAMAAQQKSRGVIPFAQSMTRAAGRCARIGSQVQSHRLRWVGGS